jgi:hypothetical protein
MRKRNRRELLYFAIAIAVPALFFATLPWNPDFADMRYLDYFFSADVPRVLANLTDSDAVSHYRDKVHPYFSLFAVTVAKSGRFLGTEGGEFLVYRMVFGTIGVFLFWLFIYRCTSALTAFAAVVLLLSTMTARVWSTLPETYLFGFATLMAGLNLARVGGNGAATLIVSLSGTVTNVALGLLYLLQRARSLDWKRTILTVGIAVLLLSALQKALYPTSVHFIDIFALREEQRYIGKPLTQLPFRAFDFVYSGFVLPLPATVGDYITTGKMWTDFLANYAMGYDNRQVLTTVAAVLAITAFLVIALIRFFRSAHIGDVGTLVAGFLLFQFLLHLVYGPEPFLYSYHYLPFLIIFVALYLPGKIVKSVLFALLAICLLEANFGAWDRFQLILPDAPPLDTRV